MKTCAPQRDSAGFEEEKVGPCHQPVSRAESLPSLSLLSSPSSLPLFPFLFFNTLQWVPAI